MGPRSGNSEPLSGRAGWRGPLRKEAAKILKLPAKHGLSLVACRHLDKQLPRMDFMLLTLFYFEESRVLRSDGP